MGGWVGVCAQDWWKWWLQRGSTRTATPSAYSPMQMQHDASSCARASERESTRET